MTTLVTGAGGFLGSHLTELLVEAGERPRALLRPGERFTAVAEDDVDIHRGEIGDRAALEAAVSGVDRVLHCAARTGPWGPEREYRRTNVQGLEILVRTALAAGVGRVVHVSSITVHGNDVRGWADESAPFQEEPNPYTRSKVAGERLLERVIRDEGAPVTIVRPGWIYGPRDRASFARIARMIETGRMTVVGDGHNRLPLIYVRDAARGVLLAGHAPHAEGRSYLLVNDEPVTQGDFIAAVAAELDAPLPTRRVPYRPAMRLAAAGEALARLARTRRPPPVMRYGIQLLGGDNRFSVARAREELGFEPLVDLAEGVGRSVDWYRRSREQAGLAVVPA